MNDRLDALDDETNRLLQTVTVVRELRPTQRQRPQCLELLRGHVDRLKAIVEKDLEENDDPDIGPGSEEQQHAAG